MMLFPSELNVNVLRRVWAAPIERAEMIRRWLHEGGRLFTGPKGEERPQTEHSNQNQSRMRTFRLLPY